MNFVVDDSSVLPIGKPPNILVRDPRDDLFDDLFALTSHNHVDIRATVKQKLDFLRCFVASNDCADLGRQLRDEITDVLEPRFPSDAYAEKIDFVPDELAECLRVLVGLSCRRSRSVTLPTKSFMLAAMYSRPVGGKTPMSAVESPKYGFRARACWYLIIGGL